MRSDRLGQARLLRSRVGLFRPRQPPHHIWQGAGRADQARIFRRRVRGQSHARIAHRGAADFPALADFLLSALYEGYSGRAQMALDIEAPDAEPGPIRTTCRAVI